jgi:hypothetical protein
VSGRLRSVGAVLGGFVTVVVLSIGGDIIVYGLGLARQGQVMSDQMFVLAAAYRAVFTLAGGYVTARLAPDRPMAHVWVLAGIGLLAGLAGVVGYYTARSPMLGPAWYAISIPVMAIPCVWLGGRLGAA